MASSNSQIIVALCARSNLFGDFKIQNPFVKTIEWEKHQNPKIWINLLKEVGFIQPKVSRSTPNRFGDLGKLLLYNNLICYLTTSQFYFSMKKII